MTGHEILDGLQGFLRVVMVIADHGARQDGFLPHILATDFGCRDVELTVQARQDRFDAAAFFLEGGAAGQEQVQGQNSDRHAWLFCTKVFIFKPCIKNARRVQSFPYLFSPESKVLRAEQLAL